MKLLTSVLLLGFGLTSCSEPEESNADYNKGRQRAEMEGCHCNPALLDTDKTKDARPGRTWADGYVETCILFRRERGC